MPATVTGIAYLGQTGEWSIEGRSYEVLYRVTTDVETDGVIKIYLAAGMPTVGFTTYNAPGESDHTALCRKLGGAKQISPMDWEVRAVFATRPLGNKRDPRPEAWPDNPCDRPIEWRWRGYNENQVLDCDREVSPTRPNGFPLINAVGDLYAAEDRTVSRRKGTLSLEKNYRVAPINYWDTLRNTVCTRVFWGINPGYLRFEDLEATEQYENGIAFVRASFTFGDDPWTWDRWIAHKGPRYKDANGKIRFSDDDLGVSSTYEVFLKADGTRMTDAELRATGPLYDVRKMYQRHDWLCFGLG
jgi:hypothetical protein